MRCPTLIDLPLPPPGKKGWPWTEQSILLPDTMPDDRPWPKVTIVTPSFNQAQYLEETIRSVLLQGYPNLEYIIIDGGSSDGSQEVIKKYEPWLAHWVSEPDRGQSHALSKGFDRAAGEILAWLNSDDTYLPGAIGRAAGHMARNPATGLVYGHARIINAQGGLISTWQAPEFSLQAQIFQYRYIPQPSAFFRRAVFEQAGGIGQDFYYTMDFDLWLRLGLAADVDRLPQLLSNYREHQTSKTVSNRYANRTEILKSLQRFFATPNLPARLKKLETAACGMVNLHQALGAFQENDAGNGAHYLAQAFQVAPNIPRLCRERLLQMLVGYAPAEPEQAAIYFQTIGDNLPPPAAQLQQFLPLALNRIIIIAATRSDNRRRRHEAVRRLGSVARRDLSWLSNRQVLPGVLGLLGGARLIETVSALKKRKLPAAASLS